MGLAVETKNTAVLATLAAASIGAGIYLYKNNTKSRETMGSKEGSTSCPFARAARAAFKSYPNAAKSYPDAAAAGADGIVTGLTNKRSSEDMGLPAELSQSAIDVVTTTTPAVAPHLLAITKNFYTRVLGSHPELLQFFNPAHNVPVSTHQPEALAGSVAAYATNITDLSPLLVPGGPVEAICHRHVALAIHPLQYVVVHDNLMAAIAEVLGDVVTPEIAAGWSEAVLFLAKAFIDTEEGLYQMVEKREGGWSGFAEFEVSKIVELTGQVRQVSFKPPAGSPLAGKKFEFTAGQYLSLQIDTDGDGRTAPRHYTCTSPVGAEYLQCSVKKENGGKISTYVHDNLKVGDKVTLAAPVGVFVAPAAPTPAVLISAGIGVTPMVNLQRSLGEAVKLVVHVDRSEEAHPYRSFFEEAGSETLFKYTSVEGRPETGALVDDIIKRAGTDNEFFICGPAKWMEAMQGELTAKGAKKVICEVFGSQLGTGCPFFATAPPKVTNVAFEAEGLPTKECALKSAM